MRKKFLIAVSVAFSVAAFALPCYAAQKIAITLDGVPLSTETAPVIIKGRTYVPARVIAENLGASVDWQNNSVIISAATGEVITLPMGSKTATSSYPDGVDETGETYTAVGTYTLDVPARTVNGRAMVPLRDMGLLMGANVDYVKGTVIITTVPYHINDKPAELTYEWHMTAGSSINQMKGNMNIGQMHYWLTEGKGVEVAAPVSYGCNVNLDPPNYYYLDKHYRFYTDGIDITKPGQENMDVYTHTSYDGNPIPEGYSQFLLHDVDQDKWYQFDAEIHEKIDNFLLNLGDDMWENLSNTIL
ncbi:MAG: copper amine oxidase N-terminal domain-containing protein [Peptococcaceae bacterium]|nr:copper amine oxidase N-terminal domain-containing protein [Peptococcaceae bacterium]